MTVPLILVDFIEYVVDTYLFPIITEELNSIGKSRNAESGNGTRGMMGTRGIKVGMRGSRGMLLRLSVKPGKGNRGTE